MQREEKQFENSLEMILTRLNDLKISIGTMVHKLEIEHETINWPTFLDNFALISGHLTGLSKIISKDLCPPLRNRTVLPLLVSTERDETLMNLTEGRVPVFAHDIVPDYLRTKPEPIAEQKMLQNEQKAATLSSETAMKQVTQFNKVVSHIIDMVAKAHEEWEIESSSRPGIQQTSSMADTHLLAAAVGNGKDLKIGIPMPVQSNVPGNMMVPPTIRGANPSTSIGKTPSTIKTNIKAAMQVHPFNRQ